MEHSKFSSRKKLNPPSWRKPFLFVDGNGATIPLENLYQMSMSVFGTHDRATPLSLAWNFFPCQQNNTRKRVK